MTPPPDMVAQAEWMGYLRAFLALLLVVGLIFLLKVLVIKTGFDKRITGNRAGGRLSVVETLYLDPRRRLVIVRDGDKEHVLLLGASGDKVLDTRAHEAPDA